MTRDEITAKLAATQQEFDDLDGQIQAISKKYKEIADKECEPFRDRQEELKARFADERDDCKKRADFLPFQPFDFVTNDGLSFYEVSNWEIDFSSVRSLVVILYAHEIRKSGTLSRYYTRLQNWEDYRKAELFKDLRLRRAIKQRLRRRLEGGD